MEWSGASKAKSGEIWVAGGSRVKTCMRLSVKWVGDHLNLVLGVHCQAAIFSSKEALVALRSLLSSLLISLKLWSCKGKKPLVYRVENGHHSYYETMSKDLLQELHTIHKGGCTALARRASAATLHPSAGIGE